jgi:TPR repeat protein
MGAPAVQAVQLQNQSALLAVAALLDAAGQHTDAMRLWKKAAKQQPGDVRAQLLYGLALYRGVCGCVQDPEDARIWLTRAVKQVQGEQVAAAPAAAAAGEQVAAAPAAAAVAVAAALPAAGAPAPADTAAADTLTAPAAAPAAPAAGGREARVAAQLRGDVLRQAGLVLGYMAHDGEGCKADPEEAVR